MDLPCVLFAWKPPPIPVYQSHDYAGLQVYLRSCDILEKIAAIWCHSHLPIHSDWTACIMHNNVPFFINGHCSDKRIQQRNSRKQGTTAILKTSACCLEVSSLRFGFFYINIYSLSTCCNQNPTIHFWFLPEMLILSDHSQNVAKWFFFAIQNICCLLSCA